MAPTAKICEPILGVTGAYREIAGGIAAQILAEASKFSANCIGSAALPKDVGDHKRALPYPSPNNLIAIALKLDGKQVTQRPTRKRRERRIASSDKNATSPRCSHLFIDRLLCAPTIKSGLTSPKMNTS